MPILHGIFEFVLEVVGELVGDVIEGVLGRHRAKYRNAPERSKYHCRNCLKPGKLQMRTRDWSLFRCAACEREWSAHRSKNIRQPGRVNELRNKRTQKR